MFNGLRRLKNAVFDIVGINLAKRTAQTKLTDSYQALRVREAARTPTDIALKGYKVYSQHDEDGVIAAIFDKIGSAGTFLEIGIEDGTECNTHLLLLKGWRGTWIDGNGAAIDTIRTALGTLEFPAHLHVKNMFVSPGNISDLYLDACRFAAVEDLDFLSLDIDSFDAPVMQSLLRAKHRPRIVCVEYNGIFPPDVIVARPYQEGVGWQRDDYMGASLGTFVKLFSEFGYRLITCNITGVNAFFAREDVAQHFPERDISEVWRPLRLDLSPLPGGHKASLRFLRDKLHATSWKPR